jgi:hypothetical protein
MEVSSIGKDAAHAATTAAYVAVLVVLIHIDDKEETSAEIDKV